MVVNRAISNLDRVSELKKTFNVKILVSTWRNVVREQIRNFPLTDLYDHYDLNYNIEARSQIVKNEIINGTYKPSLPLIYRIEKKFGISRHIVNPEPIDTLVLQVLTSKIEDAILSKQPSKNAFYARDKHYFNDTFKGLDYSVPWSTQWKEMQKTVYKFNKVTHFLVVTDLTNFYDNIDLSQLRRIISSFSSSSEVLLDVLFRLLADISWQPYYLPYSGRGLPTINIEGIRLLAHSVLFEIDSKLLRLTNGNFVRWMDDIMFGVNTKEDGIKILSEISDALNSRGHSLNLSKTRILSSEEARKELQFDNNIKMNDYFRRLKKYDKEPRLMNEVNLFFLNHLKNKNQKYWDKIAKRIIRFYTMANYLGFLKYISPLYSENPELRPNIIGYLTSIGYSAKSSKVLMEISKGTPRYDDQALFELVKLTTDWKIPTRNAQATKFIKDFRTYLRKIYRLNVSPFDFYCLLWFITKYDSSKKLMDFINSTTYIWERNSFLRRQVTASLARIYNIYPNEVIGILSSQIAGSDQNAISLANQIITFSNLKMLDKRLLPYLFNKKKKNDFYSLPKFLVLCSVLNSNNIRTLHYIPSKIKQHISDPYFLKHLKKQYNLSF